MVLKVVRDRYVAEILLRPGLAHRKSGGAEASALMPALGLLVDRLNKYVLEHPAETHQVAAVPATVSEEPEHEEPQSDRREVPAEGRRRSRDAPRQEPRVPRQQGSRSQPSRWLLRSRRAMAQGGARRDVGP